MIDNVSLAEIHKDDREIKRIAFQIMGEPVGKARPRFTKQGRAYTPKKTKAFEHCVKVAFASFRDSVPYDDENVAVKITITFFMPIPKSTAKKRIEFLKHGIIRPTHKPDIDNLVKAVLDGLNGEAYYDDRQIISLDASEFYSEHPFTQVIISYYRNDDPKQ